MTASLIKFFVTKAFRSLIFLKKNFKYLFVQVYFDVVHINTNLEKKTVAYKILSNFFNIII